MGHSPAVLNQQTLAGPASFSGIGLHSGNKVNMTFLPAPPNHGIRFRRVDLDGQPEIDAAIENVAETSRSTTLSKGSVKLHTVNTFSPPLLVRRWTTPWWRWTPMNLP